MIRRSYMWVGLSAAIGVLAITSSVDAQTGYAKSKVTAKKPASQSTGPVTKAEVTATFARVRQIAAKSILKKPLKANLVRGSAAPATRADVLAAMDQMFEWLKPNFKFSPKAMPYRREFLTLPANTKPRTQLEKLIAYGCVDKYGPLSTSKKETLTLEEFGDAVGYFVARICDLTHTPSAKFSPALMNQY